MSLLDEQDRQCREYVKEYIFRLLLRHTSLYHGDLFDKIERRLYKRDERCGRWMDTVRITALNLNNEDIIDFDHQWKTTLTERGLPIARAYIKQLKEGENGTN